MKVVLCTPTYIVDKVVKTSITQKKNHVNQVISNIFKHIQFLQVNINTVTKCNTNSHTRHYTAEFA